MDTFGPYSLLSGQHLHEKAFDSRLSVAFQLLFSCFSVAFSTLPLCCSVPLSLSIAVWKKKEMEKGKKQRFMRDTLFYTTKYTLIRIYRKIVRPDCFLSSFFYIFERRYAQLCNWDSNEEMFSKFLQKGTATF